MAGWGREHQASRDNHRSISQQYNSTGLPAYPSSSSSPSWDQVNNSNYTSSGPTHHSPSSADFNDQHYRSSSGPVVSSLKSSRNYNQEIPPGYTSGSQTHQQVGPISQHHAHHQPAYSVTGISEPPSATSSHGFHDRENHDSYNSTIPSHHGYSSSAPSSGSFHHHHHPQQFSSTRPNATPSQHPHYHQQNYPLASPSFSDSHHEFHPQLNPFEVKHRRRTTRSQFKLLESTFRENPKPNAAVRKDISQQLEMPIRAVQIWFQNRRAKAKAVAKKDPSGRPYQSGPDGTFNGGGGGGSSSSDADISRMTNSNISLDSSFEKDESRDSIRPYPMQHQRSYSSNYDINGSAANISSSSSSGGHSGFTHSIPPSSSSQNQSTNTFKMPLRPSRLDLEVSNRRMTTNSMPTSATSSTFGFNNSPTINSSSSHHLSSAPNSASYDESVFAHRPMTTSSMHSAPYDDRYRYRGPMTSPSVLAHEPSSASIHYDRMGSHQSPTNLQAPSHIREGRRSSLSDDSLLPLSNPGIQQGGNRGHYPEGSAYSPQQQQSSQSHPQNDYWTKY